MVKNLYEEIALFDVADVESVKKGSWFAGPGSKFELITTAFPKMTEELDWDDGDYQGVWAIAFKLGRLYYVMNDYYGSCSGCDALEDTDGVDYLKERCGNARGFTSWKKMVEYLRSTESHQWRNNAGEQLADKIEKERMSES
jgi:hypothetical protein